MSPNLFGGPIHPVGQQVVRPGSVSQTISAQHVAAIDINGRNSKSPPRSLQPECPKTVRWLAKITQQ